MDGPQLRNSHPKVLPYIKDCSLEFLKIHLKKPTTEKFSVKLQA